MSDKFAAARMTDLIHTGPTDLNDLEMLRIAALNSSPVTGLTHEFYNYPARFSPRFVREAIRAYSSPGDFVLDPFCGGGTTLVEAMSLGRNAVGIDISSLSKFVTEAKTLIITESEESAVRRWASKLDTLIDMSKPARSNNFFLENGYYRNVSSRQFWRIKKAIDQAMEGVARIRLPKAQILARCVLLKSSQWALDNRKSIPSIKSFREKIIAETDRFLSASAEFRNVVATVGRGRIDNPVIINSAIAEVTFADLNLPKKPSLVVTSPPYPGVHVLYHRWQVDGRKETPLPFVIANCLDGSGVSYYAMGDRRSPRQEPYFEKLRQSFQRIRGLISDSAIVVQMIAFSQPDWQLDRYLSVMEECGFVEQNPWNLDGTSLESGLWRQVPRRKWHATKKGNTSSSKEVVLIHAAC